MLRELKAEGMTMIVATHEMGFARQVADGCASWTAVGCSSAGPPSRCSATRAQERTRQFLRRIIDAGRL